jgi:hypothetical protein
MAMAGLDYSYLKEPDYNPDRIRQSSEISIFLEKQAREILKMWKNRKKMKESLVGSAAYVRRVKKIYYDTDGISEKQIETVRVCNDCGGLVMIDSAADTGRKIFAVILPNRCCPECRSNGEIFFERVNGGQYSHVYLQDREKDIFITK